MRAQAALKAACAAPLYNLRIHKATKFEKVNVSSSVRVQRTPHLVVRAAQAGVPGGDGAIPGKTPPLLEGPAKFVSLVVKSYNLALAKHPVMTKAATSLIGFALGDRIAQSFGGQPFDVYRYARRSNHLPTLLVSICIYTILTPPHPTIPCTSQRQMSPSFAVWPLDRWPHWSLLLPILRHPHPPRRPQGHPIRPHQNSHRPAHLGSSHDCRFFGLFNHPGGAPRGHHERGPVQTGPHLHCQLGHLASVALDQL